MVSAVSTLICQTADMERSRAFYETVLGLSPEYASAYWTSYRLGSVVLGLHPPLAEDAGGKGGWVVCFETADLRALRERLEAHGVNLPRDYHDTPSGAILDFRDPSGNPLQAMQPGARADDLR